MPREYRHIGEYEKEIIELRNKGCTVKEICEKFGFKKKQYENFITRYNQKQKKLEAGIVIKKKGRPPKDYVIREQTKVAELKYILARKILFFVLSAQFGAVHFLHTLIFMGGSCSSYPLDVISHAPLIVGFILVNRLILISASANKFTNQRLLRNSIDINFVHLIQNLRHKSKSLKIIITL